MHVTSRKWTKATIARIQWIARQNGGRALARTYRNARGTVECRCARGHSWMARVASIDEGTWCPQCKQQSVLDRARAQALSLGGTCLSESCRNTRSVLEWQCIAGHRWRGPAHLVLSGIWCRKCRRTEAGTLEQMQRIARERGGRCLSARYVDAESALSWRCREGHEWSAEPGSVIQGSWCRRCNRGYGRSRRRLSIEIMRDMARERGGVCLSAKYDGIYDRLRWRCAKGHEWVTAANNVRRGGWCPRCSHSILGTLDGLRAHAISFGGRCLTRAWNNHKEPLAFECAKGHRFKQIANVLKSGVWCPDCARRSVHPTGAVKARSAKMLATRGR
jgi:hypothetical protein